MKSRAGTTAVVVSKRRTGLASIRTSVCAPAIAIALVDNVELVAERLGGTAVDRLHTTVIA